MGSDPHEDHGGYDCGVDGVQVVQVVQNPIDGEVFEQNFDGG
ncbi:hypothetical protein [Catellatospora sichuanensis]|nr:hypothetical protein [Catellatospora sichuanensis]